MTAWPGDEHLPGLVSCGEGGGELACLSAHKKTGEWFGGGKDLLQVSMASGICHLGTALVKVCDLGSCSPCSDTGYRLSSSQIV